MALAGYLASFKSIPGLTVKGHSMIASRKDGIDVIAFEQTCRAPRDSNNGCATGRRSYLPVSFTACQGPEYPQLLQILDENQAIAEMKFIFYMPRESGKLNMTGGKEYASLEYTFTTAHIASLEMRQLNTTNPDLRQYEMYYTCTFVFEKISCDFKNNASTSMTAAWSEVK